MVLDVGATDMNCDLTKYKTKNVSVNTGAADIEIILGELYEDTNLNVNAGASNVEISVPMTSGCEIVSQTGLSNRDFYGFNNIGSGKFRTDNFENAEKKIRIKISGGVSNFEVRRY